LFDPTTKDYYLEEKDQDITITLWIDPTGYQNSISGTTNPGGVELVFYDSYRDWITTVESDKEGMFHVETFYQNKRNEEIRVVLMKDEYESLDTSFTAEWGGTTEFSATLHLSEYTHKFRGETLPNAIITACAHGTDDTLAVDTAVDASYEVSFTNYQFPDTVDLYLEAPYAVPASWKGLVVTTTEIKNLLDVTVEYELEIEVPANC
jgi:hypothetical protein